MRKSTDMSRYSTAVDVALSFAARSHADQRRKGTDIPYIVHPVHVARMLECYALDEPTVIAGILHDVLEDTDCTAVELERQFGADITRTVQQCSEPDKRVSWEERKRGAVERMRVMTPSARAVSCSDKAHNLHTMADAIERGERDFWQRFKRGPEAQLDYHRRALAALSTGWDHPILGELRAALARVEALTTTTGD